MGARKTFGGSWRLGRGVFGAELLCAGLREAESVSLAKLEVGCCAGAESGDVKFGLGLKRYKHNGRNGEAPVIEDVIPAGR